MLTVTQRCDSCGRRAPATRPCPSCAPGPSAIVRVLSRAATAWLVVVVAATALLEIV